MFQPASESECRRPMSQLKDKLSRQKEFVLTQPFSLCRPSTGWAGPTHTLTHTHAREGNMLSLPTHTFISSGDTHTDTPRILFSRICGPSCPKLTHKTNRRSK